MALAISGIKGKAQPSRPSHDRFRTSTAQASLSGTGGHKQGKFPVVPSGKQVDLGCMPPFADWVKDPPGGGTILSGLLACDETACLQ